MSVGMKEVKKYAHIENDMSNYAFWSDYIDWREPTPEDEINDNRCYVEYGDYTAAIIRAETAEAKLARVLAIFGRHKPLPYCHGCDSYKAQSGTECADCFCVLDTNSLMLCEIYAVTISEGRDDK